MLNFRKRLHAKRKKEKDQVAEYWIKNDFKKFKKALSKKASKNPHSEDKPFT